MTKSPQPNTRNPQTSSQIDLGEHVAYEDHLDQINDAVNGNDLKQALTVAKNKLKQSVKAERSLRQRLSEVESHVEERDTKISDLEGQLEASNTRFKELDSEYGELTLKAGLVAEGVDIDRLGQAMKLIDDPAYYTEKDGIREYDMDKFREENDNVFLAEGTSFDNDVTDDSESDEEVEALGDELEGVDSESDSAKPELRQTRSNGMFESEAIDDDSDVTGEDSESEGSAGGRSDGTSSQAFVRMRGSSRQDSTLDTAKRFVNQRYPTPTFGREN